MNITSYVSVLYMLQLKSSSFSCPANHMLKDLVVCPVYKGEKCLYVEDETWTFLQ